MLDAEGMATSNWVMEVLAQFWSSHYGACVDIKLMLMLQPGFPEKWGALLTHFTAFLPRTKSPYFAFMSKFE